MDLINDTPPKSEFFKMKSEYGDHDSMGGMGGGGMGRGGGGGGGRSGLGFGSLETMVRYRFVLILQNSNLLYAKSNYLLNVIAEIPSSQNFSGVNYW